MRISQLKIGGAASLGILAAGVLAPSAASAYGEQITQAGIQLYGWMRGLGAVLMAIGFAGVGFQMAVSHDREAMKKFSYVILGGLLIMLAPALVGLIQGVAGGAGAINTQG